MNRNLLVRFTIPSLVIDLSFFAACLISIRYIHRLQTDLTDVLKENVASVQAAQELQIRVRQLRFHNILYLLEPKDERLRSVTDDQKHFEDSLTRAREASRTAEEKAQITAIDEAYKQYKAE